jgi:hypothetical protein
MTDIALDEDYKLITAGDEFEEAESDDTDAALITMFNKGELRHAPWLGFGAVQRIKAVQDERRFVRELKVELENDSFFDPIVDVTDGIENLKIYV